MEEGSFPLWKGLFDWSLTYQDGTKPSNFDPSEFTPERRQWLDNAIKHYMHDFADRMKQIKEALDPSKEESNTPSSSDEWLGTQEALLDELMDIVCSIDHARDLHKIGGLPPLLSIMASKRHPSLRWRALEVIATCAANNPPVQDWFREGGVVQAVLAMLHDPDVTCRNKALLALSALIRHSKANLTLILTSARLQATATADDPLRPTGSEALSTVLKMCGDEDVKVGRKALGVVHYMSSSLGPCADPDESPSLEAIDRSNAIRALAQSTRSIASLLSLQPEEPHQERDDQLPVNAKEKTSSTDLRQASLLVLIEVAKLSSEGFVSVKTTPGLLECLTRLKARHQGLSQEEKEAEEEEGVLLQQLIGLIVDASAPAA